MRNGSSSDFAKTGCLQRQKGIEKLGSRVSMAYRPGNVDRKDREIGGLSASACRAGGEERH